MTELENKAIDIKGKKYVLVSDRVLYFNENYPNGSITTERIAEGDMEIIKATVTPDCNDMDRQFTGYSQATWGEGFINKTAALENAETSAVGRALAFMGIGVIDSIASADEVVKAEDTAKQQEKKEKSQEEKPRFNKEQLEALQNSKAYINKFNTSDLLIKDIEKKYRISKDKREEIAEVRADLKE